MEDVFNRHGFVMILLSWALPILPEATACLSGFTRMPFWRFLLAWVLGAYPYVTIAAYAGSVILRHGRVEPSTPPATGMPPGDPSGAP